LKALVKGSIGTIVGETNPLAFKFLIDKEVGRGTYIKVKADGKEWILAQVEDVKRSNLAYNLNQLEKPGREGYDSRALMIAEARVGRQGRARRQHSGPEALQHPSQDRKRQVLHSSSHPGGAS